VCPYRRFTRTTPMPKEHRHHCNNCSTTPGRNRALNLHSHRRVPSRGTPHLDARIGANNAWKFEQFPIYGSGIAVNLLYFFSI
jgi:hypothetical protein